MFVSLSTMYVIGYLICMSGEGGQKVVFYFSTGKLHQAGACFVPLCENKKSLSMPGFDYTGVT